MFFFFLKLKRLTGYGYIREIPKKEAKTLRALGVDLNDDNIIENLNIMVDESKQLLTESLKRPLIAIFLEIEA